MLIFLIQQRLIQIQCTSNSFAELSKGQINRLLRPEIQKTILSITKNSRLSPNPKKLSPKRSPKKSPQSTKSPQKSTFGTGSSDKMQSQTQMTNVLYGENIVALLKNQVKESLASQYIQSDSNIKKYQENIFPDCEQFQFDKIVGQQKKQNELYSIVFQQNVYEVIQNKSFVFLIAGPKNTGKTYIIRGSDNNGEENGVLISSAQDLLNLIKLQKQSNNQDTLKLFISIYTELDNNITDLLFSGNTEMQQEIKIISDISNLYNKAINKFMDFSEQNLFFHLQLKKNKSIVGNLTFIVLPYQSLQYLPSLQSKSQNLISQLLLNTLKNVQKVSLIICINSNSSADTINYLRYGSKIKQKIQINVSKLEQQTQDLIQQCFDYQLEFQNISINQQKFDWIQIKRAQCSELMKLLQVWNPNQKFDCSKSLMKLTEASNFLADLKEKMFLLLKYLISLNDDIPKEKLSFESGGTKQFQIMSKRNRHPSLYLEKTNQNTENLQLFKKNEEIALLKEENIEIRYALQKDKQLFQSQKDELEKQIDIQKAQKEQERQINIFHQMQIEKLTQLLSHASKAKNHFENANENSSVKLNSKLNLENNELNSDCKILQLENQSLQNKVLLDEEHIQALKKKKKQLKRKLDQIIKLKQEERISEPSRSKGKGQIVLKVSEFDLENKLKNLKEENNFLEKEKMESKKIIQKFSLTLNDFQTEIVKLQLDKKGFQQQVGLLNNEIHEMRCQLLSLEEEKTNLQNDLKREERISKKQKKKFEEYEGVIKEFKRENSILSEELKYQKELLQKMEQQNMIISEVQVKLNEYNNLRIKILINWRVN